MILKSKESAGLVERMKEMLGVGKKHANVSQFQPPWKAKISLTFFFSSEVGERKIRKQMKKKNLKDRILQTLEILRKHFQLSQDIV